MAREDIVDRLRDGVNDDGRLVTLHEEAADEIVTLRTAVLEMYCAIMFGRSRKDAVTAARANGPKHFMDAARLNAFHKIDMGFRGGKP